ncbi:MAG: TIGR02452 family protein [Myxococcota bacterium]
MSLKGLAVATLELLERGTYTAPSGREVDFGALQASAIAGTRVVTPAELAGMTGPSSGPPPAIEVIDATTQVAARDLATTGRVALLNFASARNPGGGFLNGARAQEEDLCRCSGLYPCLVPHFDAYYAVNRRHPDNLYTDTQIFSPGVPFFRVRGTGELLEQPFTADVITAPAPNAGASPDTPEAELAAILERRWSHVLGVARAHPSRAPEGKNPSVSPVLVLGAWGCGAFGNRPEVVARAFQAAIPAFGGAFERIVFAIPDAGRQSAHNLAVFRDLLG